MSNSNDIFSLSLLWRGINAHKLAFSGVLLGLLIPGLILIFSMPYIYRAESSVLIERQVPSNIVSTTVTGNIEERIQILQQKVLSKKNLLKLAVKHNLLSEMPKSEEGLSDEALSVITAISENTFVDLVDVQVSEARSGRASNVVVSFILAFETDKQQVVAPITNALTALILEENKNIRSQKSVEVTNFLFQEESRLKDEVLRVENEILNLRAEEFEFLPQQLEDTRREVSTRQSELISLNGEISFLESRINQLLPRLQATSKHAVTETGSALAMQDPATRIKQAQLELQTALQAFTESHPDVIHLRKVIREAQQELAQSNSNQSSSTIAPTNPEYIALSNELSDLTSKLESTKARKQQLESVLDNLNSKFKANPLVELKYNQLVRDLERSQNEYADIKSRLYEAQLAQSLEKEEKGEKFTVLSKATPPLSPVRPNRGALISLLCILSLVASATAVFMLQIFDRTLRSPDDIKMATGFMPIGVIPRI